MAYELQLPGSLEAARWKAKIRDRERVEPPHVTVLHKTRCWRIGLRDGEFLDEEPPPREVPDELVAFIREHLSTLIEEWDAMYPHNPVSSAS